MTNSIPSLILPDWPAPSGVRACITTRGEVQADNPYSGFNLALHTGDDPDQVAGRREQLCQQLGLSRPPQWLEQVHGTRLIEARDDGLVRTADGAFSRTPGIACSVLTADCLPVLFCSRDGGWVAAVHAGWRGLADGILSGTLDSWGGAPDDLLVYLGPAISHAAFEVGVEVLETFFETARDADHSEKIAQAFRPGKRPLHFFADLYALARAELASHGVTAIYGGDFCTFTEAQRFYSFRRDRVTGRMASLIWLESPAS